MYPLDIKSTELAKSIAPIDCDVHVLGHGIALYALVLCSLVSRFTDDLEPVSKTLSETEQAQAVTDVSALLDMAHRYSGDAGPRG